MVGGKGEQGKVGVTRHGRERDSLPESPAETPPRGDGWPCTGTYERESCQPGPMSDNTIRLGSQCLGAVLCCVVCLSKYECGVV